MTHTPIAKAGVQHEKERSVTWGMTRSVTSSSVTWRVKRWRKDFELYVSLKGASKMGKIVVAETLCEFNKYWLI